MRDLIVEARMLLGAQDDKVDGGDIRDVQKAREQRKARLTKRYGATPADYKDAEDVPQFDDAVKKGTTTPGRVAWTAAR